MADPDPILFKKIDLHQIIFIDAALPQFRFDSFKIVLYFVLQRTNQFVLICFQLNYFALAENESKARVKFNLLEKMIQPCGPPTEKKQED